MKREFHVVDDADDFILFRVDSQFAAVGHRCPRKGGTANDDRAISMTLRMKLALSNSGYVLENK